MLAAICPCFSGYTETDVEEPSSNPLVTFSSKNHSKTAIVSNFTVGGAGIALANTPLLQTRAYFEITVVELDGDAADFRVGVGSQTCYVQPDDKHLGDNNRSWGLARKDVPAFKVGDVVGVTLDLSERPLVRYYLNGEPLGDEHWQKPRGEVFPAVSVTGGALLEANFGHAAFKHAIPHKFEAVIFVKALI
jgi:hypothetical protein